MTNALFSIVCLIGGIIAAIIVTGIIVVFIILFKIFVDWIKDMFFYESDRWDR
jgi:hypothetical protein